jgi:fructose-bisphosphate aldolase class II
MDIWGSTGQADAVRGQASEWRPVHHVIVFNVEDRADLSVEEMLSQGETVLSNIPGVRRVVTGKAVQTEAKYQFTWLIEFVHEKVIASYRDHPDHVAFADNLFRPIAGDRISIDFLQSPASFNPNEK